MKSLKKINIKVILALLIVVLFLPACEDYLDQAPEAEIEEQDIFKDVNLFQGFVEDIYQGIVDKASGYPNSNFNHGDDVICSLNSGLDKQFDRGNNWAWTNGSESHYMGTGNFTFDNNLYPGSAGSWDNGWGGIRRANMGLERLEMLENATSEQIDIIKGQLYFFRAYYHFDILKSWGGIPYITKVFEPTDDLNMPRLAYHQVVDSVNRDLQRAVDLLPKDWSETAWGNQIAGNNSDSEDFRLRINKGAVYGIIGKNYLYAASPLMKGLKNGTFPETNDYDLEYAQKAAEAFAEVIKLANEGYYALVPWDRYSENFYRIDRIAPITEEYIFNNPPLGEPDYNMGGKTWNRGEFILSQHQGYGCVASPTQNYVELFGMSNGLPIDDPASGYDPTDPWSNRDPRFDYNIVVDGERITKRDAGADTYAQFFTGGRHRNPSNNVTTGYLHKKFKDITCNRFDRGWGNWRGYNWIWEVPNMRLADVYLMYAEAVNEVSGPNGSINGGPTAIEAVNIVRRRANVPDLITTYTANKDVFRETVRNERAVELAFEGHRYDDLRRWRLAHLPEHKEKYALDFDKDHTFFNKTLFVTRVFDEKHYWLPFPQSLIDFYPAFKQNTGW